MGLKINEKRFTDKIEYALTVPIRDVFDMERSLDEKILVESIQEKNLRISRANSDICLIGIGFLYLAGKEFSDSVQIQDTGQDAGLQDYYKNMIDTIAYLGIFTLGIGSILRDIQYRILKCRYRKLDTENK